MVIRKILYHLAIERMASILINMDFFLFFGIELESMDDIKLVTAQFPLSHFKVFCKP